MLTLLTESRSSKRKVFHTYRIHEVNRKHSQHQILVNGLKAVSCALQPQNSNGASLLNSGRAVDN